MLYIKWLPVAQMEKSGVEVRLNTCPTPADIASEGFDALLAATGASPKQAFFKGQLPLCTKRSLKP